jgi:hypothetical protein
MATVQSEIVVPPSRADAWIRKHCDLTAFAVLILGFFTRLRAASGIFLNPDEALHFRLANQLSLEQAYRESLTASHPPLLTFVLYFWRAGGTSDLWLRMPLIFASIVCCWVFYKWLNGAASELAGLIGLVFVALLPPVVTLSTEIRQYPLLLCFLAVALYFLDSAFDKNSAGGIAAFSVCLYLAMLSHYSSFLFAAALGVYALARIFQARPSHAFVVTWVIGQIGALALALFLYRTHISKLGAGESRTPMQGWMSEFFLRRSYFDPARDHWLAFLVGHTFGVFQYFFGQLVVGDLMCGMFVVGVFLLFRNGAFGNDRTSRWLGLIVVLPFVIASSASLAHVYPSGGTRHMAFLLIPAMAGVSVAIVCVASRRWIRGVGIAALVLIVCVFFGKPRRPFMERADQSNALMAKAVEFVAANGRDSAFVLTDYQSDLILGHYLCGKKPLALDESIVGFESFSCGGVRVLSADYKTATLFDASLFGKVWEEAIRKMEPKEGSSVLIFQAGWDANLPEELSSADPQFRALRFESFGSNIKIFKLIVGQTIAVH